MNKIITKNGVTPKKTIAAPISMLIIIIWIIFSVVYIIQDKWQDYQISKMQQAYQQGVSDGVSNSVRTLMTESSKCNKVPLYYKDQTMEVVALSCLPDPKEDDSSTPVKSSKQPPIVKQPSIVEQPEEMSGDQPSTIEQPEEVQGGQPPVVKQQEDR